MREMLGDVIRVEELSNQVLQNERKALEGKMAVTVQAGYRAIMVLGLVAAVALVLNILLGLFAAQLLVRPLLRMEGAITELADGNLTVKVEDAGSDEIGRTAQALSRTLGKLHGIVEDIHRDSTQLTDGAHDVTSLAAAVSTVSAWTR